MKYFVIVTFATIGSLAHSGEVNDACSQNDGDNAPGVCSLIVDCPDAIKSIKRSGHHGFKRCGFQAELEIVCCPLDTAGRIDAGTTSTERSRRTTSTTQRTTSLRRSERVCKELTATIPTPLDLHILGGEEARDGEFPHMAALGYYMKNNKIEFQCGGSLISEHYVLTAAHCVVTLEKIEPSLARLGVVALGEEKFNPETDYQISNIINHPEYGRPQKYHDLSLLRLSRAVEASSTMHPACLYTRLADPDKDLIITGWGAISSTKNTRSSVLLKANVTAVPVAQCSQSYSSASNQRNLPRGITSNQLCAGDSRGKQDTCQGDSGGPLQVMTPQDGMYRIVGVTSFGRGCGSSIPGVYTRVASYLDWIEDIVWPDTDLLLPE